MPVPVAAKRVDRVLHWCLRAVGKLLPRCNQFEKVRRAGSIQGLARRARAFAFGIAGAQRDPVTVNKCRQGPAIEQGERFSQQTFSGKRSSGAGNVFG